MIHSVKLITNTNFETYAFVSADIELNITHKNKSFSASFQSGHRYYQNNYSLPSNSLTVYAHNSNLLEDLDKVCESEIDDEKAQDFNAKFELDFTTNDYLEIYQAIIEARIDADIEVQESAQDFMTAFENDTRVFVEKRFDYQESEYFAFDTKEEADYFKEQSHHNESCFFCTKEVFYTNKDK